MKLIETLVSESQRNITKPQSSHSRTINPHLKNIWQTPEKSMADEFHLPLSETDQIPTEVEDFEVNTTFIDEEYFQYLRYLDSGSNHRINTFGSYDEIFGHVLGNSASTRRVNAVEELPVVEFTAEELMERGLVVCAICREELVANEKLSELPCRHYYHKDCISSWLSNRNTCPLCRHDVELPNDG